ncbi:MAG: acetyl-CoA C-acetyltransferase [Chitinispirillaceae bacterium]|nr:acetyl-CoA C-acetyltransferase [Chitinispirillaceae bacterium]
MDIHSDAPVIAGAVRTAIGKFGGMLSGIPASQLGTAVISEALQRAGVDSPQVDEVFMGNVLQAGQGQNPARQAAMGAGLSQSIPSTTVNMVCASGLKSISLAVQAIRAGEADVMVAGGMECMSHAPYLLEKMRWGNKMGNDSVVDAMIRDGLWCVFGNYHMGLTAENVAEKFHISRADQDEFACRSQQRAEKAIKEGRFVDEIVAVEVPQPKGSAVQFFTDEFPRYGTTVEKLAALKPSFKPDGTVTAGNASGINDGAACVVVASRRRQRELGLPLLATIRAVVSVGVDPAIMGTGPLLAVRKILAKTGISLSDIDLVECNEAFASQMVAVGREIGWDEEKVNVNGGAIALGHPIGASGARILVTLLYEMKKRDARRGLATLCVGGGMGMAMVVERE